MTGEKDRLFLLSYQPFKRIKRLKNIEGKTYTFSQSSQKSQYVVANTKPFNMLVSVLIVK